MQAGDFSTDNADNQTLCPTGFTAAATNWCNNLAGIRPSQQASTSLGSPTGTAGQSIPSQFIDPGAKALASIFHWPKANANPCTNGATCTGPNYVEPIDSTSTTAGSTVFAWITTLATKATSSTLPISRPTAPHSHKATAPTSTGLPEIPSRHLVVDLLDRSLPSRSPGHFVHTFNATTTNEFIAAWGFGSFPFGPPNQKAADKSNAQATRMVRFITVASS